MRIIRRADLRRRDGTIRIRRAGSAQQIQTRPTLRGSTARDDNLCAVSNGPLQPKAQRHSLRSFTVSCGGDGLWGIGFIS
jgi:hypothetical protein